MMPPLGLEIYLWPRVTLTFDLLTFKVDRFTPLPCETFVPSCNKIGWFVFKITCSEVWQQMNDREDRQADKRTDGLRILCLHLPVWLGSLVF